MKLYKFLKKFLFESRLIANSDKLTFDHYFFDLKYYLKPTASQADFSILFEIPTERINQLSQALYYSRNIFFNMFIFLHKINILSNFLYFFYKKESTILIIFLLIGTISFSQITAPYAVNIAGNQVTRGSYAIEWSVGESAAINIMDNSDRYIFTNGLLQFNIENQTETNLAPSFLTNEVRVYPNPVRNELFINILHASKGNDLIELLDEKGAKLKEKIVVYNGMGALEIWNLGGLKAGQYFVNIRHTHPVTGKLIKKGAYKILKIN